ncbi:isoaspartyl peptidase/L-asparaginase family protein [Ekhidna sp.]|uniref:isoaspartyl peptidase/L-asparaginase family protein n=1 Tax=Ekhidna sp. TaxID=2608089 RepID=UPI003B5CF0A4
MSSRRKFIKNSLAASAALGLAGTACADDKKPTVLERSTTPKALSTWNHGLPANEVAMRVMQDGGSALDGAEKGVMVVEADPTGTSVGIGGAPDRDGNVTLDACIMDNEGNAGSVCFLQSIKHPIAVARKVMEETPHVMLAGEGAKRFALAQGFAEENLLTENSRKAWEEWVKTSNYEPVINVENHDTIGMICQDANGNLSGSCTTSGLAYKMHGRVGDSPIIGAGLFVDNDYGAAVATGMGELMMKTLGSFLVVELIRQGANVQEACEEAIQRIVDKLDYKSFQVGYLAMDIAGNTGAYAIHPGFNYAEMVNGKNELIDAKSYINE